MFSPFEAPLTRPSSGVLYSNPIVLILSKLSPRFFVWHILELTNDTTNLVDQANEPSDICFLECCGFRFSGIGAPNVGRAGPNRPQ